MPIVLASDTDCNKRNYKQSELNDKDRYNEGKENSHNPLDSSAYSRIH